MFYKRLLVKTNEKWSLVMRFTDINVYIVFSF